MWQDSPRNLVSCRAHSTESNQGHHLRHREDQPRGCGARPGTRDHCCRPSAMISTHAKPYSSAIQQHHHALEGLSPTTRRGRLVGRCLGLERLDVRSNIAARCQSHPVLVVYRSCFVSPSCPRAYTRSQPLTGLARSAAGGTSLSRHQPALSGLSRNAWLKL
jgi:hypothetical protein